MTSFFTFIGNNARYMLSFGVLFAFIFPDLCSFVRPALPALIIFVFTLAMSRVNTLGILKSYKSPTRFLRMMALMTLYLVGSAFLYSVIAKLLGLNQFHHDAMVYVATCVPLASTVSLSFIYGLNASIALEAVILGSLLMPFLAPPVVTLLIGENVPLDSITLMIKLGKLLLVAFFLSIIIRKLAGAERINAAKPTLDGLATLTMLVFVFPLFDGVGYWVLDNVQATIEIILLSIALVILPQIFWIFLPKALSYVGLHHENAPSLWKERDFGAFGLAWGFRSIAIYLAILPNDPMFTAFVGLYQLPMYFTPILIGHLYKKLKI